MKTQRVTIGGSLCLLLACGGEAVNQPAAEVAPTEQNAVTAPTSVLAETTSAPATAEPPAMSNDEVAGLWCQYWIPPAGIQVATPVRRADSEQYLFMPDGRFGWRAEVVPGQEPRKRSGQWRVSGSAIVLSDVGGQVIEQVAISDCPPNPEAEQVDAEYRCRSLNGNAFWFIQPADSVDDGAYIP